MAIRIVANIMAHSVVRANSRCKLNCQGARDPIALRCDQCALQGCDAIPSTFSIMKSCDPALGRGDIIASHGSISRENASGHGAWAELAAPPSLDGSRMGAGPAASSCANHLRGRKRSKNVLLPDLDS